ncbi:MAG: type II toxin-antitoxin system HicB family antitoxin [Firmicutes bacterium]|nr:type II toxin-antitoxin system HicB family antitoxin [Bacillota bacterium]
MLKVYPAIFHEEDGFWVEFPDLEGCNTCGTTLEETMELAQEALGLYLISLIEDRKELPAASSIRDVETDEIVSYISVDVDKYRRNNKAVKKTLSLPAWLAEEAERNNLSLSKVLQEGLKAQLGL